MCFYFTVSALCSQVLQMEDLSEGNMSYVALGTIGFGTELDSYLKGVGLEPLFSELSGENKSNIVI